MIATIIVWLVAFCSSYSVLESVPLDETGQRRSSLIGKTSGSITRSGKTSESAGSSVEDSE